MRRFALSLALAAALAVPASLLAATPASNADIAREAAQLLERSYPADGPGGALLIARGDEVLYRGARGEADLDKDVPLAPDSLFRIGSITKQFAAAGLLKLVEAGKVSLDDPLSKYVTDFPNGAHISVRQLLNHTSGVKSYTSIPAVIGGPKVLEAVSTAQLIDSFENEKVDFAPGESYAYNNSGYVLVGAVIEAASGMPWHRYLEQALFEPLGMTATGYGADPAIVARQVHGYSRRDDKPVLSKPISMTWPHAAGALVSNVDDLLKWNRALHEGRVLKDATYRQMITPEGHAAHDGSHYGFGIANTTLRGRDSLGHGGGIHGFSTFLMYLPGPDLTVAVLENSDAGGAHGGPTALARRLAAVAIGDPYPVAKPVAVDAAALKAVEGVYRVDPSATRVLRVVDGQLTAQRGGGSRSVLTPIAVDEFLYDDGFNRFRIERDADGTITGMRFFPDGEGDGVIAPLTGDPLPAEPVAVKLPRAALERVAGIYSGNGMTLKVFLDGEALKAQLTGQPAVDLAAASPTRFDVPAVGAALEFADGDAPAQSLKLTHGPAVMEFKRSQ